MDSELIIKAIVVGYFYAGLAAVAKVVTAPMIDRPGLMMNPTFIKKLYWGACWPIHTFIEAYYLHMPNRPLGILYGIFTIPCMWLGFAILGLIVIYPYQVIDTWILAFGASIAAFIGSFFVMPIIVLFCTFLVMLCVAPFKLFIPKPRPVRTVSIACSEADANCFSSELHSFIDSHNYLERYQELQGQDQEFAQAALELEQAASDGDASPKVIGALIIDSIRKYAGSRDYGIAFLEALSKKYQQELFAESDDLEHGAFESQYPKGSYHLILDQEAGAIRQFFVDAGYLEEDAEPDISIVTELLLYIVVYFSWKQSGLDIHQMSWNSFKTSIENRILSVLDDVPSLTSYTETPSSKTFTQHTSRYWGEMDRMEMLIEGNDSKSRDYDLRPVSQSILSRVGCNSIENASRLTGFLMNLTVRMGPEVLTRVIRSFS